MIHRSAKGRVTLFLQIVCILMKEESSLKRAIDKPYFTYSGYTASTSGICVKCPKCNGLGIVSADKNNGYFKCTTCGASKTVERTLYRYDVHNQCKECGRHYRVDITDENKQHYKMIHVACPYCGHMDSGKVQRTARDFLIHTGEMKNGCEPYFGLELWFLACFANHVVWAINREHLSYLITYLSADVREKPRGIVVMKTQVDHLPTFMKTAKNRDAIVKLLKNMQKKMIEIE